MRSPVKPSKVFMITADGQWLPRSVVNERYTVEALCCVIPAIRISGIVTAHIIWMLTVSPLLLEVPCSSRGPRASREEPQ